MKPSDPPTATSAPAKVLLVDDEQNVLDTLHDTLRLENYNVVAIANPIVALEELKKTEFAAILSDQRMPGMTGLELLAQARDIQPHASRILITAVLSLDTVIQAINKDEIYRFIIKPWLREELIAAVHNAVRRYELIHQNLHLQSATEVMNEKMVGLNRALEQQVKLVEQQNQQLGQMNEALEQNLIRSMELGVHITETYYPALGNQVRRVFHLCRAMAQVLDLSAEDRRILESAALMHDIGLIGVPRSLIKLWQEEPDQLGPAERALLEQHPILSQEMSAFGTGMDRIGTVIRAHHERFDGTGYPDGLAGENIPWLARLLAVAVAFAANTHSRDEAVDEIKRDASSAFDPEAVRVFLKAITVASVPRKERQVQLSELRPGMVLARGIYNNKGILLVPEGHQLNTTYIEKLLNHNRIQPITQSLVVYC